MADIDPFALDPSDQEKMLALAKLLQGQREGAALNSAAGQLATFGGQKDYGHALMQTAQQQTEDAQSREQLGAQTQERMLTRALQAKKEATEEKYRQAEAQHMTTQEELTRRGQDLGKYSGTPYGVLDTRTGQLAQFPGTGGDGSLPAMKPHDLDAAFDKFGKAITTVAGRSNLNVQNANRLNASERVKQIALDENGNIRNLTPQMMAELATATAGLVSNGAPTEGSIEKFLPHDLAMKEANVLQFLTSDPQGANQQEFVKQIASLAQREEKLLGGQIKRGQLKGVPQFAKLRKYDKTRFDSMLKAEGLNPDEIDENGLPIQPAPAVASAEGGGNINLDSALPPEKQQRLDELRKKRAAGQLK